MTTRTELQALLVEVREAYPDVEIQLTPRRRGDRGNLFVDCSVRVSERICVEPFEEPEVGDAPVGVAACQVKSVPSKLSFCPSPLTCPALWSNENVYSGWPSKETCLDPS